MRSAIAGSRSVRSLVHSLVHIRVHLRVHSVALAERNNRRAVCSNRGPDHGRGHGHGHGRSHSRAPYPRV